jgi:hypothetical protein
MDKSIIKETMLSLEGAALQSAREKHFDYVADASLDRSELIESDEQAQAEIASDLSEALDDTLQDHTDKLDKLREVDFAPKSTACAAFWSILRHCGLHQQVHMRWSRGHRYFHNGPDFRGNRRSTGGEAVEFNGRKLVIEDVA